MSTCECGCGSAPSPGRRFITGHNLNGTPKTKEHRAKIAAALRLAWRTKRNRLPVGTKRKNAQGYIIVKVVPGAGRWREEHIIVAERMKGRPLRSGEVVHHINGDRSDNRRSNLYVCRDRAHHNEVHRTQDAALRECLSAGVVRFRRGKYEALLSR